VAATLVAACQAVAPGGVETPATTIAVSEGGNRELTVTPRWDRQVLELGQLTQSSVRHLEVKVFALSGTTETLVGSVDLLPASFANPIRFTGLRGQTTYRVRGYAYGSLDTSNLISVQDSRSAIDVTVTDDTSPTVASLRVQLANARPVSVTTLSGSGVYNRADGVGVESQFQGPQAMAFDTAGNMFVVDQSNHLIRKITPEGVVTTVAGTGSSGFVNGPAATAQFAYPTGIAVDGADNLYVSESNNACIRKITPDGTVSTFAGTGVSGYADGPGATAQFGFGIRYMAFGPNGNLYVAEGTPNARIRMVTPQGVVSTVAGNGTRADYDGQGVSASFNYPCGLTFDAAGNMYVTTLEGNAVRKITASGYVSTLAGSTQPGLVDATGTSARFYYPLGIAADASGNLFVADSQNNCIRKITSAGVVTTFAGSGVQGENQDGTGTAAGIQNPRGVVIDATGTLFVSDGRSKIRKITAAGVVTTFAGNGTSSFMEGGPTRAQFSVPKGMVVDAQGGLYVADVANNRIRYVTAAGVASTFAGNGEHAYLNGTGANAAFAQPRDLDRDAAGNFYVADSNNHRIRKITPEGVVTNFAGTGASGSTDGPAASATFSYPNGLAVDAAGNVYVADMSNNLIRKIDTAGTVSTYAGTSGYFYDPNAVTLRQPTDVALDAGGNLYVADKDNHSIRRIAPDRTAITLAGPGPYGQQGWVDGVGAAARFNAPEGLTVDAAGNVYVADTGNRRIRKVTPTGQVTTLAGNAISSGLPVDGAGSNAGFVRPLGLALDATGALYVGDNLYIRKMQ
jgi:sugar lactone lactonase YvrE